MSLLFCRGHNAESLMSGDSMNEPQPKESLLKKSGRIGAILGFVWIALNNCLRMIKYGKIKDSLTIMAILAIKNKL